VMLVPNAEVFTSRIINNTADPLRRGKVEAWIGYDTDLKAAVQTACDAASQAEGVLHTPAPAVRVNELGQNDIALEVTFWTDSRRADYKNTASAVREAIVSAFKEAGIGLPEPDVRVLRLPAGELT
ncbi:MAG: mechanosensitive ion channel family protein, partial [Lysobacterales bacterium]